MRVLVTGSSGLIGTALVSALRASGHDTSSLVRRPPGADEIRWDPSRGSIDSDALEGHDAVVHLAGVGIGDHRWTDDHKAAVLDSRVKGTSLLSAALAGLAAPPSVMASGSAVGYYGADRGDEALVEDSPPPMAGTGGFLADVVARWEAATAAASGAGIRVAHLRSGVVMSAAGGALRKQLPAFRIGVGGRLGSGRQYLSWVDIDDEVAAIIHVLETDTLSGGVNLTAPTPVTNAEFTATLGRVLRRPTVMPVPTPALNLMFGRQMVSEMILRGQRVLPQRLVGSGFAFAYPDLESSLRHQLSA